MTTVYSISVADIRPHPNNPRQDLGDLTELADSIRSQGVLQPITVAPDPGNPTGYMCLLGHRRHAASQVAGQTLIPAMIREDLSTVSAQIAAMFSENTQRSDLTPVEEGLCLQEMLDLGEIKRSQLSKVTGMSKSTVSSRLKLAALPGPARDKVHTGQATLEEALQLADADLPADVVEDLTTRLGTPSFRWELENALRAATAAKERAQARTRLEAVGVTWSDNHDGIDVTRWGFHSRVDLETDLADLPEGCMAVPGHWGSEVNIYRPLTPEELAQAEERQQAKKEPRWGEIQKQRYALVEPLNVARALRRAFLTPYTTGAKLLTPGQSSAVFDELIFGVGAEGWEVDDQYGWLDHTTPTTLQQKHALVLTPEGRDRLALAALAAAADGAPDQEHDVTFVLAAMGVISVHRTQTGWGAWEPVLRWYALLEHLGYLPSEWENERISLGLPDLTEDDVEDGGSGE